MFFFLAFCSIHSRFFLAFFIFLSPSHPLLVLVNKAVCVQTLLWYSPPSPSCPFPLSFLPLLFSGEIKAHTVTALTISPKNPPLQKSSKLPPSQAWAEWETLGCGWEAEKGRGHPSHSHIKGLCVRLTMSKGHTQWFIPYKGDHSHKIFHPHFSGEWRFPHADRKEKRKKGSLKERGQEGGVGLNEGDCHLDHWTAPVYRSLPKSTAERSLIWLYIHTSLFSF